MGAFSPLEILLRFVVLIVSLTFHEAAHAWTANRLGDPTARDQGRLTLNPLAHIDWIGTVLFPLVAMYSNLPLIGWAKPVPVDGRNLQSPRRDFAIVAAAGPISNLILAAGFAIIHMVVVGTTSSANDAAYILRVFLYIGIATNVLLALFNMIPVPPLDGGNVAMGVLPAPLAGVFAQIRPFGFLILYALMLSGILWDLIDPVNRLLLGWLS
ncbi:MAG TPA: site-2 protease family protein [Vicinamibacterales bacterium]|nr:site-2 protease family protein [Vicinamibacterales bacterium]